MGWFSKKKYVDARTGRPVDVNASDNVVFVDQETGKTVGNHRIAEAVMYSTRHFEEKEDMDSFFETHVVVGQTRDGKLLYARRPGLNNKIFGIF